MICGGSPCQDFSVAGKQKGSVWKCNECGHEYNPLTVHYKKRKHCPKCESVDLDKSRSSLLVEWLRIIEANKPNWGMYENVKAITGKKFEETFSLFVNELREYGYNVHWKVLNAKDYGVPQNRERVYVFIVKEKLDNGLFKFPEPFDNGMRLRDILEQNVDEHFYIPQEKVSRFITSLNDKNSLMYDACQIKREEKAREYNDYSPTLTSRDYKDPRLINDNVVKQIGNISDSNGSWKNPQTGRIYSPDGCSPTLNTCGGGQREPKVIQMGNVNPSGNGMNGAVYSKEGVSPTLTTNKGEGNKIFDAENIRIRKLIPLECFRLMDFEDSDFYAVQNEKISNSQMYKLTGNSIVVGVLYYIFKNIYNAMPYLFDDLRLGSYFSGIGAFEKALNRLYMKDINNDGKYNT